MHIIYDVRLLLHEESKGRDSTVIIVDFETDAPILREARAAVPEMTLTVEAEQAVDGRDGSAPHPIHLLFWAAGGDYDAFEAALEADPTVTDHRRLADTGRSRLYRVVYTEEGMSMTAHAEWVELDATLLEARTNGSGWSIRMRFPDRESVSEFKSWFDERGLPFVVTRMFTAEPPSETRLFGLTEKQRETLQTAWEHGYFDVPRRIDLDALSRELGISDTAVSQRLRRGTATLIENGLMGPSNGEERTEH